MTVCAALLAVCVTAHPALWLHRPAAHLPLIQGPSHRVTPAVRQASERHASVMLGDRVVLRAADGAGELAA